MAPRTQFPLAFLLAATLQLTPAATAQPFAYRSIALGAALDDVRRVRFPEAGNARLVCTHDPEGAQLRPTMDFIAQTDETKMGVTACSNFRFERRFGTTATSSLGAEWVAARVDAGGIDVSPVFWFVPSHVGSAGEAAKPKLYRIAMRSNSTYWATTKAAFTRRYGEPASIEKIPFVGYRGAKLDNERVVWTNADSTITMTKRGSMPNLMAIVFEHNTLTPAGARQGATPPIISPRPALPGSNLPAGPQAPRS